MDLDWRRGSKPELLAVLALMNNGDAPIICNGFKDDEFIETVILAQKLGKRVIPVVEKFTELELIVKYAEKHGIRPAIGVRVKLATQGQRAVGIVGGRAVEVRALRGGGAQGAGLPQRTQHAGLPEADALSSGQPDHEYPHGEDGAERSGADLCGAGAAGAGMEYIDVGGGLGIDYDGSQTNFESSINYSLQEYASDVVFRIKSVCDEAGVKHPHIISESGPGDGGVSQRADLQRAGGERV